MTYIYERIYSTDDYGRIFSARKLLGAVWGMCLGTCVFAGGDCYVVGFCMYMLLRAIGVCVPVCTYVCWKINYS